MNATVDELQTIVEYSATKAAENAYPEWIVSPPAPSPCCATDMKRLGELHFDPSGPYFYKSCATCGHTVRHFLLTAAVSLD